MAEWACPPQSCSHIPGQEAPQSAIRSAESVIALTSSVQLKLYLYLKILQKLLSYTCTNICACNNIYLRHCVGGYKGAVPSSGKYYYMNPRKSLKTDVILMAIGITQLYRHDWMRETGDWMREAGDWMRETGDWMREAGDWMRETGNWMREAGDWMKEAGNWMREPGDWMRKPDDWMRGAGDWMREAGDWMREAGDWMREADDRIVWSSSGETFVQQWNTDG